MGGISARSPSSIRNYTGRVSRTWTSPKRHLPHRHPSTTLLALHFSSVPSSNQDLARASLPDGVLRFLTIKYAHSQLSKTRRYRTNIQPASSSAYPTRARERRDTKRAAYPAGLTPLYAPIITTEPVSPQSRDTSHTQWKRNQ